MPSTILKFNLETPDMVEVIREGAIPSEQLCAFAGLKSGAEV
ncbi:hypothetical protein RQN30_04710 [Arcanobacterium hippocoleae]